MLSKLKRLITGKSTAYEPPKSEVTYKVSSDNLIRLDNCNESSRITALEVTAADSDFGYGATNGIGYVDKDGKTKLTVRVHGKSFLDGKELVRLMKKCDCPVYLGDEDDNHFLYDATHPSRVTAVSNNHAILGTDLYYARLSADLKESFAGITLKAGLAVKTSSNILRELSATNVTTGRVDFTGTIAANYEYDRIIHNPVSNTPALSVRYDSVMIAEDISTYEAYDGHSTEFEIGSPLLDLFGVADSIDLISGCITRRVENIVCDENTEVTEVSYCGNKCFLLNAPGNAGTRCNVGGVTYSPAYDFEMYGEGVDVSSDYQKLYLYLGEDMELEDVKSWLIGKTVNYMLAEPRTECIGGGLDTKLYEGLCYIEICSPFDVKTSITYTQTE